IAFLPENIMHLLGIKSYSIDKPIISTENRTPSYSRDFYNDFEDGCLNFEKCWVESLNKVIDKLAALKYLPEIRTENVRIGGAGDYIKLNFSNLIRTNVPILGIAVTKTGQEHSVPISTLNLMTDKRVMQHTAFRKAVPCTKLRVSCMLENGSWQIQETISFVKHIKKKKKKKKK
ncbi:PBECR4 domain-containing protein, partial [Carnobacterium mobile]|uniref:PBECR4 domain-containing protein n=1 Tax=Carnobacterium mobile TaxID=2750 RepID=UPI001867A307